MSTAPVSSTVVGSESAAPDWHVAARVVLPRDHDPDALALYVEYGTRAPRIDDSFDRNVRGWGEYKGVEKSGSAVPQGHAEDILSRTSLTVRPGERASFATYFNAFPASYWRRWTAADRVRLDAAVTGSATILVYRSTARGATTRVHTHRSTDDSTSRLSLELDLAPFADGGWYWFDVLADSQEVVLQEATWSVRCRQERPARLSIGVTTVNKVSYVAQLVEEIAAADELREHLDTVWVVDQGTDPVEGASSWPSSAAELGPQLQVIHQKNLGGSGGFSRGMYETMQARRSTFHLVLDDDVRIEPEAILRAVRFASHTTRATIVGAHMFDLHHPTVMHTFGEVVHPVDWTFTPVLGVHEEHDLALQSLRETPWMHRRTDVTYNGWWMCLIPVEVLDAVGLSLPVFIKWDDSEHCLRAGAAGFPTVSLPGAAVWHMSFNDKDDLWEWQAYFHQRNLLVSALLHSSEPHGGRAPLLSFQWLIKHAYSMRYYANAVRLKGLRDLFRGPQHLHENIGTILPELRAMTAQYPDAQYRPNQQDFPAPSSQPGRALPSLPARSRLVPWTVRTGLRHLRPPASGAADQPQVQVPARYALWWFLSQYDSALVSRADGTGVAHYRRDTETFRAQLREGLALHLRLYREWDELARTYRAALPELTSPEAWRKTFGLDDEA